MVRRHHQQQRIGRRRSDAQRGDAGGRRGIAADRLEQNALRRHAGLAQLLAGDEAVLIIGDQDGGGEALFVGDPQRRLLQQRALGDQRQKLFRVHGARHGPKPRAGAAGQDDGMDWGCTSRHLEIPSRGR